jgi:hypothetical protein
MFGDSSGILDDSRVQIDVIWTPICGNRILPIFHQPTVRMDLLGIGAARTRSPTQFTVYKRNRCTRFRGVRAENPFNTSQLAVFLCPANLPSSPAASPENIEPRAHQPFDKPPAGVGVGYLCTQAPFPLSNAMLESSETTP